MRRGQTSSILAVALVVGLIAVAGTVVWRRDLFGRGGNKLPDAFQYRSPAGQGTDPALVRYRQTASIPLPERPHAIAVGPEDRIYVAVERQVLMFTADGKPAGTIAVEGTPRCLAVGGSEHERPGRIYVGVEHHVEVFADGKRAAVWPDLGSRSILTSIAAADRDVLVADAGNRLVHRFDLEGKRLGEIGRKDESRNIPGFIIPSPYFDVAISLDGLVRVANPGRHRVEGYTLDGHLETSWGEPGEEVEMFCGCCNPANFAILPDGRFVTSEKGIPRIKVYNPQGKFECVVAGPEILAPTATAAEETRDEHRLPVFDVAADSRGRVLMLDAAGKAVRIFERNPGS